MFNQFTNEIQWPNKRSINNQNSINWENSKAIKTGLMKL